MVYSRGLIVVAGPQNYYNGGILMSPMTRGSRDQGAFPILAHVAVPVGLELMILISRD